MKPVGICKSLLTRVRTKEEDIFSWENALEINGIPYKTIDCYHYDIVHSLEDYSGIIWHYQNFVNADLMEAQHLLDIAESKGLKVFPDHNTAWHFDDKIAESYLLDSVGAPIPKYWVFYELDKVIDWAKNEATYPLVAKLRRGSGSNNVKIMRRSSELIRYSKRMLTKGYSPAQSILYKTYSKVQSAHSFKALLNRAKRIPDFLKARAFGKGMPIEKGYCYFQEFIENDGYDLKVVVVGDKCTFLARNVRKGSFKASGGGDLSYDRSKIPTSVVEDAFITADALGSQCMGFDFVVNKETNKGVIIEMCYGFDFEAVYGCGGYWDRDLTWHEEPFNTAAEVVSTVFAEQ